MKINLNFFLILSLKITFIVCERKPDQSCYKAAVFERSYLDSKININESLILFDLVAEKAYENGASIIVFPENGIFREWTNRLKQREYLEFIPEMNANVNPCEIYLKSSPIIYSISCTAKKYGLYIVINMGEIKTCSPYLERDCYDGFYQYNTNVVVNDKGVIVAKYNKYHLFNEKANDFPMKQQFIYFDTPFGRFGTFICFDMIFKQPGDDLVRKYNVDTVLFTTHWFDEAPFLTAHQFQQAWSIKNKVNLLSANINHLVSGSTGSGIYSGLKGAINYRHEKIEGSSILMISNLPKNSNQEKVCKSFNKKIIINKNSDTYRYKFMHIPLDNFNKQLLEKPIGSYTLCQNYSCCSINYSIANSGYPYTSLYFVVKSGHRRGQYPLYEESCAVLLYNHRLGQYSLVSNTTFNYLKIKSLFYTKFIYPSVLGDSWDLIATKYWNYKVSTNSTEIIINNNSIAITNVALYGRTYEWDPKYP